MKIKTINRYCQLVFPALAISAGAAWADSTSREGATYKVDIAPQELNQALREFAKQSGLQVVYFPQIAQGHSSTAITGDFTLEQALTRLLTDTGLTFQTVDENTVAIQSGKNSQLQDGETESESQDGPQASAADEVDEEVVVTGSRIARRPSEMAATVLTLDTAELLATGETTLEGALRQLPQNIFGSTPVSPVAGGSVGLYGAPNYTAATTINLRGLGAESTLILVDGRRIGKSGLFGGVTDISGIPMSSVERVEIMLDGASAIYGSDAVGGVVNIITKKDFGGGEVNYQYSAPQEGGFAEHLLSINRTERWESGRINGNFQYRRSSNLDGAERPDPLRWRQALDQTMIKMTTFVYQGERYLPSQLNALLGLPDTSPWFAAISPTPLVDQSELEIHKFAFVPEGYDGQTPLSLQDLTFPDKSLFQDFTALGFPFLNSFLDPNGGEGITLLGPREEYVTSLGLEQELQFFGAETVLTADVYYSQMNTTSSGGARTVVISVPTDNPIDEAAWRDADELSWELPGFVGDRPAGHDSSNDKIRFNIGLRGTLWSDWQWSVEATHSKDTADTMHFGNFLRGFEPEFTQLVEDGLNVYASDFLAGNAPELLDRFFLPPQPSNSVNKENTAQFLVNGDLLEMPGGTARLAVGGSWQQESVESLTTRYTNSFSQNVGGVYGIRITGDDLGTLLTGSRSKRSAFAELLMPLVGMDNAMTGIKNLLLTGAASYDSYHGQDSDSTWSLGLVWNPMDQVTVKARRATAFQVPALAQQFTPSWVRLINPDSTTGRDGLPLYLVDEGGNATSQLGYYVSELQGSNPDLGSQTSASTNLTVEFSPEWLPGLSLSASWHETVYSNRIGAAPAIPGLIYDWRNGRYTLPDNTGIDYETAYGTLFFADENGNFTRDFRTQNTAFTETTGMDYQLRYDLDTEYGQFSWSTNVGRTLSYNVKLSEESEAINHLGDQENTFSKTLIPPVRYSTTVIWSHRGASASLNAHTSDKTINTFEAFDGPVFSTIRVTTAPATAVTLRLNYDLGSGDLFDTPDWLGDGSVALTVNNLLDDHQKFTQENLTTGEPFRQTGFNPTSKDPRGRMYTLSITRRF